jgi:hypothetical protein
MRPSNGKQAKDNDMSRFWRSLSRSEKALITLFILTIPFVHARVRGDGIGYYAYARSLLIDHNLQFASDWKNPSEELLRFILNGHILSNPITKTGHLPNQWSVGPAILWSPFLVVTHLTVLGLNRLGWQIIADGHSWPYMTAMAGTTALYAFLGVYLSFRLARNYVEERWAFLAAVGIWLGSSLPVYIYLDPSWSHAHSAFCTSLFLWYWLRTRPSRTNRQWVIFGLISGLMIDVHFTNIVFILAPLLESLSAYYRAWRTRQSAAQLLRKLSYSTVVYVTSVFIAFLPTLITRQIIFGNPFRSGMYTSQRWNWTSPAFVGVLFSSNHGLLVCTPILLLAFVGLILLCRSAYAEGMTFLAVTFALYCLISFFPWWDGTVGLGNRYFVSLTPLFVLGLAVTFSRAASLWNDERAAAWRLGTITVLLLAWNLGLVYQWSTNLMPIRTRVYWDEVLYNQFRVVPGELLRDLEKRFLPHRNAGV